MIFWLKLQSTEIISLVVFGFIYLAAAIIFLVAVQASRASVKEELRTVTPGVLSPLGAILGIMIAFLAARVWANVDRAEEYVTQEISALRQAALIVKSCRRTSATDFRPGSRSI